MAGSGILSCISLGLQCSKPKCSKFVHLYILAYEWVKSLSRVQLFATPWTIAYQAPQSMGFSRQEYWSGLPFPSPEDPRDWTQVSHIVGRFFTVWTTREVLVGKTVWITTNCGKFFKRWEYQTTLLASWEICMQIKKQQLEPDMEQVQTMNGLVPNWERSMSRLYIVTLLI